MMNKSELDVADFAGVLFEPLYFDQFGVFFVREVDGTGLFFELFQIFASEGHFADGEEECAGCIRRNSFAERICDFCGGQSRNAGAGSEISDGDPA